MPEIYPKLSKVKLKKSARKTSQGRAPLPGVQTDARHAGATDKCGYQANRGLAKLIRDAVRSKKKNDKHGARFVLGWRLYPNQEHPSWNSKDVHSCGCGCGCHS